MPIDLVCLRSFVEVVERRTIAAAASALGYTAPAVSQHVSKLERDLDAALFDRHGGRLAPTAAGRALVPIAVDMLDLEARGRAAVHDAPPIQRVVIAGFASAIAATVIPALAAIDEIAMPEIIEAEDHEALRELGLGHVDVALVQEYDDGPASRPHRLTYTPLVTDALVLVLPPQRGASTTVDQLADEPWLLNGTHTRCADATLQVLSRHGVTPRVVGRVDDNATLLALVASGRGVTILPELVVDQHAHRRLTVGAQRLGIARTIHAVTRAATTATLEPILHVLTAGRSGSGL